MRLFLLLFFGVQSVFAQTLLKGRIISDEGTLEDIMVVNDGTKETVTTNAAGEFSIMAKSRDELIVASPQIDGLSIILNAHSFEQKILEIKVNLRAHQLEDVVIRRITTKSLGIVSNDIKEYTPAERRLKTAMGGIKNQYGLDTRISLDQILNFFSGRTANLEKELQIEKFESNYKKLKNQFEEEFYLKTLQFVKEDIDGFLVYVSENPEVGVHLEHKNKELLKLKLVELAFQFKQLKHEK